MESWCISEPFIFPAVYKKFLSVQIHILSTNTLYILHSYKQLTENISKRASQKAGGDFLS